MRDGRLLDLFAVDAGLLRHRHGLRVGAAAVLGEEAGGEWGRGWGQSGVVAW